MKHSSGGEVLDHLGDGGLRHLPHSERRGHEGNGSFMLHIDIISIPRPFMGLAYLPTLTPGQPPLA